MNRIVVETPSVFAEALATAELAFPGKPLFLLFTGAKSAATGQWAPPLAAQV
jgi:hypothetical protein